jgi:hypothetical protein
MFCGSTERATTSQYLSYPTSKLPWPYGNQGQGSRQDDYGPNISSGRSYKKTADYDIHLASGSLQWTNKIDSILCSIMHIVVVSINMMDRGHTGNPQFNRETAVISTATKIQQHTRLSGGCHQATRPQTHSDVHRQKHPLKS